MDNQRSLYMGNPLSLCMGNLRSLCMGNQRSLCMGNLRNLSMDSQFKGNPRNRWVAWQGFSPTPAAPSHGL